MRGGQISTNFAKFVTKVFSGTAPELYDFYKFSLAGKVTVLRKNSRNPSMFSGTAPELFDF